MEIPEEWFPALETEVQDFMTYDEMTNIYDTVDNLSVDSFSPERYTDNMKFIDQSLQPDQHHETKTSCYQEMSNKRSRTPEPDINKTLSSSNTFTISFGNQTPKTEIVHFPYPDTTKVQTTVRSNIQIQDHVLAERKRREKLNHHFISLSSLLPNLKKMDKASVLEDASNYIKQLKDRVKELEELTRTKMEVVQECFISSKRSRISDDEYSSSEEMNSKEKTESCKLFPEIEVRVFGSSVLVRIQCQNNISSLMNTLTQMQKLGLSIVSSSSMPFAKNSTILIIVVAEIKEDFCLTTKELVQNLQLVI